jgi:hypothetical protein
VVTYCATAAVLYVLTWLCTKGILIPMLVAAAGFGAAMYWQQHRRIPRKPATEKQEDTDTRLIEVMQVEATQVFDVDAPKGSGPALLFKLKDGQLLLLSGPWLLKPSSYRAPERGETNNARFNGLGDPYGFPSTRFAIHRWKGESVPFWIEVQGWYLLPQMESAQIPPSAKIQAVEVFPASGKDLQASFNSAFIARS